MLNKFQFLPRVSYQPTRDEKLIIIMIEEYYYIDYNQIAKMNISNIFIPKVIIIQILNRINTTKELCNFKLGCHLHHNKRYDIIEKLISNGLTMPTTPYQVMWTILGGKPKVISTRERHSYY